MNHVTPRAPAARDVATLARNIGFGLVFGAAALGCTAPESQLSGEAAVSVLTSNLGAADLVGRLVLTISDIDPDDGVDMPDAVHALVRRGDRWQGEVDRIEPGLRRFHAVAFDAEGVARFDASVDAEVEARQRLPLALILQQIDIPDAFANRAPRIRGMVGNPQAIGGEQIVHLRVIADDPDGDPITYAWNLGGGQAVTVDGDPVAELGDDAHRLYWQAPLENGLEDLSISVSDDRGATTAFVFQILVDDGLGIGGMANVAAEVNGWPAVERVVAGLPGFLEVGTPLGLEATASDIDEDALTYAWSAPDCDGAFDDATVATPIFTLAAAPAAGICTLRAIVDDGRGGQGIGELVLDVAPETGVIFAPVIETTFQSDLEAEQGLSVELRVEATDPNGEALAFDWRTDTGDLVPTRRDLPAGVSHADYEMGELGVRITATVTNESGASSQHTFIIGVPGEEVAGACGGDNLLRNPSFEEIPPPAGGQGQMPAEWQALVSSPDTYSNDGSHGLSPEGAFTHFAGVTAADGIRWIAGASFPEVWGQALTAPLEANGMYRFGAQLHQASTYPDAPAMVQIILADSPDLDGRVEVVGTLRVENGLSGWEEAAVDFQAPADAAALGWIVVHPDSSEGDNYPGMDDASLTACPN